MKQTSRVNMKRTQSFIVAIILIFLIVMLAGCTATQASTKTIKVGAILPLSGPVSIFGNWAREGMDLALDDIGDNTISIVYEDSKLDSKEGITAFTKLTDIDDAQIIISSMSAVSVPLIPLAQEQNIPLFLQDVTTPNIAAGKSVVLRHFIQSDREASALADYALNTLQIRRIGILHVNDEAGKGAQDAFQKIFTEKGGGVLSVESFDAQDKDMRTQILKLQKQPIEGIYLFGNGPSWATALKQIKELGFNGKIFTNTAMFIKNFRDIAGNAIEGVYFTYPYADQNSPSTQKFVSLYKTKYGREPALQAYYAWDIVHVLAKVIEKNNGAQLKQTIIEFKEFDGAFGTTTITEDGEFLTPLGIGVIENSQIKTLAVK